MAATWQDITSDLKLYAIHAPIVFAVAKLHKATLNNDETKNIKSANTK